MNQAFKVIDLVSQALAVTSHVRGWSAEQIIDWLAHQGQVESMPEFCGKKAYSFCSREGITAHFFLDEDEFTFIGDNTLFRPR
jgi:hypothetical protein